MITRLRIVTWNAEGMFVTGSKTRRATPHDGIAVIKKLDADIIFVPEFGDISRLDESIVTTLHALGYEVVAYEYGQAELGAYGAALITRLPLSDYHLHQFGNTSRKFIEATLELDTAKKLRIVGVHLDDRSEEIRLQQVPEVSEVVNSKDTKTIVLGDFNAMHATARFARFARTKPMAYVATHIPHQKLRSVGTRVTEMAIGSTLIELLAATKLHDLDTARHTTISARQAGLEWLPSIRLAKIDWILGSTGISTVDYRVLPDVGSDHRPVLAVVDVTL